jgi:predicted nuclease of restriction endonuclease-like (RecB) superfamily
MRQWYLFWTSGLIWQQVVANLDSPVNRQQVVGQLDAPVKGQQLVAQLAQIPWGHNLVILSKIANPHEALFYVQKTIENNWSRAVLTHQIEGQLYRREGKAITNFEAKLPKPQSDLARQILKDPYNLDFLTLREKHDERELEDALTSSITKFLLELGQGFAYVGRQVPVTVGEQDFFIDLLFYHLELRCYIVIELKAGKFEAEYTGKLGLYISAINHQRKKDADNPTIGLLICKTKDNIVAEYSLESTNQPIGISEYQLSRLLPDKFKSSLPSIEEIEAELEGKV